MLRHVIIIKYLYSFILFFRNYALRRTRDAFHKNKTVTDSQKIQDLINEAKKNLEIIKRQVQIHYNYSTL